MSVLLCELRNVLENTVITARQVAEEAAQAALTTLAVSRDEPFATMSEAQRQLRRALRAKARQLGNGSQEQGMPLLIEEIAYEQWHRLLFARFLAENELLIHPEGVAVTLRDCAELAPEEGAADAWELAVRYAGRMLPGIFSQDTATAQLRFAPEGRLKLERLVYELPVQVFTADDSLGWVYQFWQTQKQAEVNASERKIGGADIAPVTQFFTEDYMVQFLLENSLGAWWATRHPHSPLVQEFEYLRFREDGTPAAGTFSGWPEQAAEVTLLDPCCGSGHFLVAGFELLRLMRMEEEALSAAEAGDAVLRDNIFGLEIDPRCTQLAAFALIFAAWKTGGYREVPLPHIACSGIAVQGQLSTWTKLAGNDDQARRTLTRLYHLFSNASDLGSLINPSDIPLEERMFEADYDRIEPLLEKALQREQASDDPASAIFGEAATGVARAAKLLAGRYTLIATNVPYMGQNKQGEVLFKFCTERYPKSKRDLATVFIERIVQYNAQNCSYAVVVPQNWLFLNSYKTLRLHLLKTQTWDLVGRLGVGAFETISGEVVNTALVMLSNCPPTSDHWMAGCDVSTTKSSQEKSVLLRQVALSQVKQVTLSKNPDARITIETLKTDVPLLSEYADSYWGIGTGDSVRFTRQFWEIEPISDDWEFLQVTFSPTSPYTGRQQMIFWQNGKGDLVNLADELGNRPTRGFRAWGKNGVAISQMGGLYATLYTGEIFQNGVAAIVSKNQEHLEAIWAFCSSSEFHDAVRKIDQKLSVTNLTLVKVPFDLEYWEQIAEENAPLPAPYSDDPTQWLFKGDPYESTEPLQVAVARLLGYKWPDQKPDRFDKHVDKDGIVCLPAVGGEPPAAERLRSLLAKEWSPQEMDRLLAGVGFRDKTLEQWLMDGFFSQHCKLFNSRPFIWHIWDGRKDGFSTLVNYHKLDDSRTLDRLIYTYLGRWITNQRARRDAGEAGADGRLVAALQLQGKLEAIREGEKPYDIYVRWKELHQQPLGWEPDLNDGVRLNIRPFVKAGVLRSKFTMHWKKDRGKNPDGSERHNDLHLTRAEKIEARNKAGTK